MTLSRYARLVAWATAALLFAGALVTSTGSGLAVPDWPTTFGHSLYAYPLSEMTGGVLYEHTHRMLAGVVGLLAAGLAVWVGLAESRRWVKALAAAALLLVVAQGLLGGATVLLGLPPLVSTAHAILGTTFFVLVFLVAAAEGRRWREAPVPPADRVLAWFFAALVAAVIFQIAVGGVLRHTPGAYPDLAVAVHIGGAVLVLALVGLVAARTGEARGVPRRIAFALVHLVVFQLLVGFGSLAAGKEAGVLVRSLHLVMGALVYAYAALGLLWSLRPFAAAIRARARPAERAADDLAALCKARLVSLVGVVTAAGHLVEAGPARWGTLLSVTAGTVLLAAGAAAGNELLEADVDARMPRTKDRPVAAGRISRRAAAAVAVVLSAVGALVLVLVHPLAALFGVLAWVSYLFFYTPAKRLSVLNTLVGAVPGALPVLMGTVAGAGRVTTLGVNLFALLYVWQIPHFLALAWIYRTEYRAAGLSMLGTEEADGPMLRRQVVLALVALLPISLFPVVHDGAGLAYAVPAGLAGLFFLAQGIRLARRPTVTAARGLFRASLAYCPAVLAVLFLARWF